MELPNGRPSGRNRPAPIDRPKEVTAADGKITPLDQVKDLNPPSEKWTGAIVASGLLNRGNTDNEAFGRSANATRRRDRI